MGIFGRRCGIVPGGCRYWGAPRGMKGSYIGFQSMIVSIFHDIPKYGIFGHVPRGSDFSHFCPFFPLGEKPKKFQMYHLGAYTHFTPLVCIFAETS